MFDIQSRRAGRKGTTTSLDSGIRKRAQKAQPASVSKQMERERQNGSSEKIANGRTYTVSRNVEFRDGQWGARDVMETAIIVTEPRARDVREAEGDEGDSGISETPVEEHLLPQEGGGGGGGDDRTVYSNGKRETILETLIQIFIPFMIAGFGMMAAGLLLDEVQVLTFIPSVPPLSFSCSATPN